MVRTDLPTGTVTFLFTDVEMSTRLLHALGPEAYAAALEEHRALLRHAFAAAGGVEVDTQGDAFFVAFPTAAGAADGASAAHAALARGRVLIRAGLHTGTPRVTGEGYVGEDVNRGARIAALAHGGQTLASAATASLLDGADAQDLGLHRLKDFDGATRIFQVGAGDFAPLRSPGSIDLPTPATPFLGRQRELLDAISVVLERDPRVLTIIGPGGTGKTRFAIELARLLADEADGGTTFLPVAPLRDAVLLVPAIAERLGAASADVAGIAARVGESRTHLVLDNVEQLLPDAAPALAALTTAAPALHLLVTSREALRIQGEAELDLQPMVEDDAVELFIARARAVRSDIERTEAVDALCARLDRLPLAVELAAARTKLLSPEALLERLGAKLDVLRGTRDADPRHATLEATIGWSYDLLDEAEQRLFARLSVFLGGCTLEMAEEVCGAELDTIASLLDKSLLRRRTESDGTDRYWMLETIREFAATRLERTGAADEMGSRLARRMLEIARSAHLSDESGLGTEPQRHDLVIAERDNVRAALAWASDHDIELALEIATVLEHYWVAHYPAEGLRRVGGLLERARDAAPALRASALRVHGGTAMLTGERESAVRSWEASLAEFERLGDERGVANLLLRLAIPAAYADDTVGARNLVDRALELGRRSGVPTIEAVGAGTMATILVQEGDFEAAYGEYLRGAELAAAIGFTWWQANMLSNALELGLKLGRGPDVEAVGLDVLRLASTTNDRISTIWALTGLAQIELGRGELELAGRLWGAVVGEVERDPIDLSQPDFPAYSGPLRRVDGARFLQAALAGRAHGIWSVAAELLGHAHTLP